MCAPLWTIVLAGGDGERLQPFIERWLGRPVPKQYCTFVGTRSMLDHTLDRAAALSKPGQMITVVARSHRHLLRSRPSRRSDGRFVFQPTNRGTAAGVLFGLSHVPEVPPNATVAILPSDHFVHPEWRFLRTVRAAARAVERHPERLVLLGVAADGVELDYGWITPGDVLPPSDGRPILTVASFCEKPTRERAMAVRRLGGLWNTMVVIAKVRTLWALAEAHLDALVPYFEGVRETLRGGDSRRLNDLYTDMPARDFSADLLQQIPHRTAVMELTGVTWSDWGRPERIVQSLLALGTQPHFPLGHLDHVARDDEPQRWRVEDADVPTPPATSSAQPWDSDNGGSAPTSARGGDGARGRESRRNHAKTQIGSQGGVDARRNDGD